MVADKLAGQASKILGEEVVAAAMVVPPGATLYKAYSGSKLATLGGPIAAAIKSKTDGAADGAAGSVPTQMGVLGLTADRAVYFKKKTFGVGVSDQIAEWPRTELSLTYDDSGQYPGLLIEFADGSTCAVFGEPKWGLEGLASA